MKPGTKEFYDIMDQFEKDLFKNHTNIHASSHNKSRAPKGLCYFYEDGNINNLFNAYLLGYQYARCLYNQGAEI